VDKSAGDFHLRGESYQQKKRYICRIILFPDENAQADGAGESGNSIKGGESP
jgi:hypothetical protein